jgi:hypothetical protein
MSTILTEVNFLRAICLVPVKFIAVAINHHLAKQILSKRTFFSLNLVALFKFFSKRFRLLSSLAF